MRLEGDLTWKDIQNRHELYSKVGAILRDWAVITRNKEQRTLIRANTRRRILSRIPSVKYEDFDTSFYKLCELTASLPLFLMRENGGKWLLGQYAEHNMAQLMRLFPNIEALEKREPLFGEILLKLDLFSKFCGNLLSEEKDKTGRKA